MPHANSAAVAIILVVSIAAAAVVGFALEHAVQAGEARFELQAEEGIGHFSGLPAWQADLHHG